MKSSLKHYQNEFRDALNIPLMKKSWDRSLIECIEEVWKSLEVVPNIKIDHFEYSTRESDIDINKYIFKREKKRKKNERYDYKYIKDNRVGLLTVYFNITLKEKDPETEKEYTHVYPMSKSMLIPIQDDEGYYFLGGKKYYIIYQLVEKSTYTSSTSVTLKSLMPIAVNRGIIDATALNTTDLTDEDKIIEDGVDAVDTDGKHYRLPVYSVFVFRKEIPVILFYLKDGIDYCLSFLNVDAVIDIVPELPEEMDQKFLYFQLSTKCFIIVNKELFLKYPFIQSVVGGLINVCTNRVTIDMLNDPKVWIKKISLTNNYEKGRDILNFFGRLLDVTTQKILKIEEYHRQDIYTVLRWMMQEYNYLRLKDNMDLKNKRLRCNEVISSVLTQEFSNRLNRIISLGEKATIDNFREMFRFPGDILIQKMHSSGILRFDESVNDMNFFSKFKYTIKGPNSMGRKNSKNIAKKYRDIHPSYIGYIDCFVCGNSDPGTSGVLSPFNDLSSFYFDDSNEKDNFMYLLQKDLERIEKESGIVYIKMDFETEHGFYQTLMDIEKYTRDKIKLYGTSREDHYEIVVDNMKDIDDTESNGN